VDDLDASIQDWFDDAHKNLLKFGSDVAGTFANAGKWVAGVGADMVAGLSNGLRDAWGGLMGTLHDLAMSAPRGRPSTRSASTPRRRCST
jgi:hypothetical protein